MKRRKKGIAALLLALCVALGLLPALTPTARAAGVNYLYYASEADAIAGKTTSGTAEATSVTSDDTEWNGTTESPGWYVVDSTLENTNCITVTGDVRLILCDGATLTASQGIIVNDGNSLTIYAQSTDEATMGKLSATGGSSQAGIGGYGESGGSITVNGGAVTANGDEYGAGIGGGGYSAGGTITVNGGAVTANGGNSGAGIGSGGYSGEGGGTITVNGGTVTAKGGDSGAGIGSGSGGAGGTITVNGGAVTATGASGGAGIGGGTNGAGGTITVNGGSVTANGGSWSAGIGGGYKGASGAISITGGTVNANGNVGGDSYNGGAGIGGGDSGDNSDEVNSISITGGTVTATVPNGTKGAAIGNGGGDGTDVSVTIGAGLTVGAGTSADGTGAKVVTDVANNKNYKYAKITVPVPLDPVSYLDWDATNKELAEKTGDNACKDYALVTASDTVWGAANETKWYVVNSDVTIASRITVTGDVRLILKDSAELTASAGINVSSGNSLTIYAQSESENMGVLSATGGQYGAGIGGELSADSAGGAITINGGKVTANGGKYGAGIGGGGGGAGGTITVNGGAVTANGGVGGAGIGGGSSGASGAISITGGTVNANGNVGGSGSDGGAGIGGGYNGDNSGNGNSISITGGTVTATVPNGTKGAAIGNGGGNEAQPLPDGAITIGEGLTVEAGTDASGTGASVVTDVANNTSYKYAKITLAPAAPSYTITAADTTTETNKKYHYGDEVTIAVTVSGDDFEGGEFTLTYDSNTLEVKTLPANNKFTDSEQTAGTVKFEALNRAKITDGQALATITFTVKTKVTTETTCDFTFEGTPKICYDTGGDSVEAATVTNGRVTVEPITYTVTLTGNDGVTFVNASSQTITTDTAIDGQDYSVTIGEYSATDYEYAVTLAVEGTQGTTTLTPSDTGVITVDKDNITGKLTVTVTRTTKHVTPTLVASPTGEFTLSGLTTKPDTTTVTDAIKGLNYVVTIGGYSATDYEYAVTLAVEGTDGTTTLTPSDAGVITVEAAKVTGNLTVTVTRTTKHVTPTLVASPTGEFTLSGLTTKPDTTTVTDAIKGLNYVVTISDYDAANYAYAVTLTMNGASATAPTPDTDGKLTIEGADITGDFTLTVTKTLANFEVNVYANYVTGWTLVTIAKAEGRTDEPVYDYDGSATYYVNAYNAYAYLVKGAVTKDDAKAKVSLGTSAAGTIAAGYDVNNTGKVDYSDALLTYRCYVLAHPEQDTETGPATAMETYLRADVNGDKKADTTDVSLIDGNRTQETT